MKAYFYHATLTHECVLCAENVLTTQHGREAKRHFKTITEHA